MLEFDDTPEPSGGPKINPKDVVGHLLLVWTVDYVAHSPTQFTLPDRPSDVIIVDCVDLDMRDPETNQIGMLGRRCWWRQAKLIGLLKPALGSGKPKLAQMQKGQATKGQAPFVLIDMRGDHGCVQRANTWMLLNPTFTPSVKFDGPPTREQSEIQQAQTMQYQQQPVQLGPETELERMARLAQNPAQPYTPPLPPRDPPF